MQTAQINDTIAAIATPFGRGGVGVLRLSGPMVVPIANQLFSGQLIARQAQLKSFKSDQGDLLDKGLVLYFAGPNSFTGEDVLEFHGHGSPVVMDMLMEQVIKRGARVAEPGEFSKRAFMNGKMDLAQAEAVADLIHSTTQQAALCAARSLQGEFSAHIHELSEAMVRLRMFVEAAIDFPDEDIEFIQDAKIQSQIETILERLHQLTLKAKQGQILREGIHVLIIGQPNAGKSSLLNALTQQNSAIVTAIPGTTRDLIKEQIQIDGIPIQIIDSAGIRDNPDEVEQEGIARAKQQLDLVDRILLVADCTQSVFSAVESEIIKSHQDKTTLVYNKIDLTSEEAGLRDGQLYISAKTGQGIPALLQHLKQSVGFGGEEQGSFIARRRHLDALTKSMQDCQSSLTQLQTTKALELVAYHLKQAHDALGEIVGRVTSDALLGHIFSSFCIGK